MAQSLASKLYQLSNPPVYYKLSDLKQDYTYQILEISSASTQYGDRVLVTIRMDDEGRSYGRVFLPQRFSALAEDEKDINDRIQRGTKFFLKHNGVRNSLANLSISEENKESSQNENLEKKSTKPTAAKKRSVEKTDETDGDYSNLRAPVLKRPSDISDGLVARRHKPIKGGEPGDTCDCAGPDSDTDTE